MHASRAFCSAPKHVYAGVLTNRTQKPVVCVIHYGTATTTNSLPPESISVTLDAGGRAFIPEREYQPTPEATFTCRKVLMRIGVNIDGKSLQLEHPFDGVSSPVTDWRFDIHDDHIASVNPTTPISPITNPLQNA